MKPLPLNWIKWNKYSSIEGEELVPTSTYRCPHWPQHKNPTGFKPIASKSAHQRRVKAVLIPISDAMTEQNVTALTHPTLIIFFGSQRYK